MQPDRAPNDEFATASLGVFRAAVDLVDRSIRDIRTVWSGFLLTVDQLITRIRTELDESWWGQVIEWFTDDVADVLHGIERSLADARAKVSEVLDRLEQAVIGSPPVESLFTVGLDWSVTVNTGLSRIVPEVRQSGGIDSWHGPARETYLTREQEQENATDHVTSAVKELSIWLSRVGLANVQFIGKLFDQAGLVIEKIVEMTADVSVAAHSGDLLSGQEAINDLTSALGRFASNIIGYLTALGTRLAEVVGMITAVAATHSDYRAFPDAHWPRAVKA
ncbi:hypothetical protein [Actinoplanes sp. G11-F43]|uniref:hypothetical protein n=1 Tax=Actinoplanes sp. G11-F43 TaxID=3424130 RepID=UPI003D34D073